jgi:hypothetical protein
MKTNQFTVLSLLPEEGSHPRKILVRTDSIFAVEFYAPEESPNPPDKPFAWVTCFGMTGVDQKRLCIVTGDLMQLVQSYKEESDGEGEGYDEETVPKALYEDLLEEVASLGEEVAALELKLEEGKGRDLIKDRLFGRFIDLADHLQDPSENTPSHYLKHLLSDIKWDLRDLDAASGL